VIYSHEHKLARAFNHLETYNGVAKARINLHANSPFGPFKRESEIIEQGERHVFYWNPVKEFSAVQLGLMIGDCLHNLRSALDHLALELAVAYTVPLPAPAFETSEFPIFWKRPMNTGEEKAKIGFIHPNAIKLIKSIQPYHRGTDYKKDPLWILNELERIDKHRTLHIVHNRLTENNVIGTNTAIRSFNGAPRGESLKEGAKVAEFVVERVDPNEPMHMNYRPSSLITLEPGLPLAGNPLGQALRQVFDDVKSIAIVPLERFL
jgi:hypothetical protein